MKTLNRRAHRVVRVVGLTLAAVVGVSVAGPFDAAGVGQAPFNINTLTQDQLFHTTTVWNAHLTFTQEQWKRIQPAQRTSPRAASGEWLQGMDGGRNGWAAARGIEFEYVRATLDFDGMRFADVAVRYKGNGTFNPRAEASWKRSFKIDLNKHVKGQKIAGVSTLNFHNAISDPSYMNEPMASRIYRDAGVPAPRTAYVRVWVTITGEVERRYAGLYWLAENVDTNFVQARFTTKDGAILKPVSINPFRDLGSDWANYVQTYDPKTDLTAAEQQRVMEFCRFVTSASVSEFNARVGEYVELDNFSRYLAVVAWFNNFDSILERGQNYYTWQPTGSRKFHFIPWDQDHSFGNFRQQGSLESLTRGNIYAPSPVRVRFIDRMMGVPAFRALYLQRLREFTATVFSPERLHGIVTGIAAAIRPDILNEPPKPPGPRLPANADNVAMFDQLAAAKVFGSVVAFARERNASVNEQLASPPVPSP
jgi:spore coat protein H